MPNASTDAHSTYQRLIERVETFAQAIHQRYPTQLTCHAGCDGCCYQTFTIFPLEAHHMAHTVAALDAKQRDGLRQAMHQVSQPLSIAEEPQPCVLLDHDGRCRLYDGRPLICRMQGYPLFSDMIERPDGGKRDCCPLNFTDTPLAEIDPDTIFNLDLVNQTLAAINHLFVEAQGETGERVSIRQAVLQALDAVESPRGESL